MEATAKPRVRVKAGSAPYVPPAPTARASQNFTAFDAGKFGRRLRSVPTTSEAINRTIRTYGRNVLARSRYLCANNPFAASAKESYVNALVGNGIKPSFLLEAELKREVADVFQDWTDQADADWLTDFYGLQNLVAGEMFEAGECFIRLRPRFPEDGLVVPLQLQLLPAEMLDLAFNVQSFGSNSARIECGIEFDAIGRRVAYHFWNKHPGNDSVVSLVRTRVPASEVLHLYKPMNVGQIRGVPHTVSAVAKLAIFDQYDDAELERKRTAALFSGFIKRPALDNDDHPLESPADPLSPTYPEPANSVGLEPGAMVDLLPGEEVEFAEPADVGGNYEMFTYRQMLGIAAGLGVPYMEMTGDLRSVNYGSQRGGTLAFRRRIEAVQNHVIIYQFCRPVINRWLSDAVLVGAVPIPRVAFLQSPRDFRRVKWIPPKWDWIDPLKDRQAEKIAVEMNWKSRDDVIEAEGYEPEETDARIAASKERADDLGITPEPPAVSGAFPGAPKPGGPPVDPDDEQDDEDEDPPPRKAVTAEATQIHAHITVPVTMMSRDGKKVTNVTGYDSEGRITSFEQVEVDEDDWEGV